MLDFSQNGYAIARQVISNQLINDLIQEIRRHLTSESTHGMRNLTQNIDAIASLACSSSMINLLTVYTQKTPKLVKAIYFNKTQDNNWLVGWHQDKTIALQEKIPTPGYINWTKKQGVIHVQPPLEIMENILTLRIHLDRTDLNNGALKVIPKTHKMGFLNSERIKQLTTTNKTVVCEADAGDILIMSPLIVHSSAKSINNCDRRIIHLEYTLISLPQHLHWAES